VNVWEDGGIYKIDNRLDNCSLNLKVSFKNFSGIKNLFGNYGQNKSIEGSSEEMKGKIDSYCKHVEEIIDEIPHNILALKYLECLGFCHSLINIDGSYIGDPLEVEMVKNSPYLCFYESKMKKGTIEKIFKPNGTQLSPLNQKKP
jgi:hypothetical protein